METREEFFAAILLHPAAPNHDRTIQLPRLHAAPPARLRVPADEPAGADIAIYELVDAEDWPRQAAYRLL